MRFEKITQAAVRRIKRMEKRVSEEKISYEIPSAIQTGDDGGPDKGAVSKDGENDRI